MWDPIFGPVCRIAAAMLHIRDVTVFPGMKEKTTVDAFDAVMNLITQFLHLSFDARILQESLVRDMDESNLC
jgi:hypothetical protein